MKKILSLVILIGFASYASFLVFSCSKESKEQRIDSYSKRPFELYKEAVSQGKNFSAYKIVSIQPEWVTFEPNSAERGGKGGGGAQCTTGDCCCQCTGRITFNNTTPANLPWQLDLVVTCSDNVESLDNEGLLVGSWIWSQNAFGSTANFNVIDEHHYWFIATVGANLNPSNRLNVTVQDAVGTYHISIPDAFVAGLVNVPVIILHCDNISFSNCFSWDANAEEYVRHCCL